MVDYKQLVANATKRPEWLHFGAGNIFRGFIARIQQDIIDMGLSDTGIVVCEAYDEEIIDKIYEPYDNEVTCVTLKKDGTIDKRIVKSLALTIKVNSERQKLVDVFKNKSLQMISFTITEKGYDCYNTNNELKKDIIDGTGIMRILTDMLYERYKCMIADCSNDYKITLVSMDNCSNNGDKLKNAVITVANYLVDVGVCEKGFVDYLNDESLITFPISMIDKITPRPSKDIADELNMPIVITKKNTYIAPFVNMEQAEYLVIEDNFAGKRLPLDKGGVYLTDKQTVKDIECMKVTTCLNPLHTALAIYGCLLGYTKIADEMLDTTLTSLINKMVYEESIKVVKDTSIISARDFVKEVIEERLPNPFIPDTPQRIACDTSKKVGIRFGETIKAYVKDSYLDVNDLTCIPLVIAGWFRYLCGVDDKLNPMELSFDPLIDSLQSKLEGIVVTKKETYNGQLRDILKDSSIFGIDLCEAGLADKIEEMFVDMIADNGSVRRVLEKYVN